MTDQFDDEHDEQEEAQAAESALAPLGGAKNYITPDGLQRLKDELKFLLTRERPAVTRVVAWAAGNGESIASAKLRRFEEAELQEIYSRLTFLPGYTLAQLADSGRYEPARGSAKRPSRVGTKSHGTVKRASHHPIANRRAVRKRPARS